MFASVDPCLLHPANKPFTDPFLDSEVDIRATHRFPAMVVLLFFGTHSSTSQIVTTCGSGSCSCTPPSAGSTN